MADVGSKRVSLQLLDSALGRPLQTWDCSDRERLSIGRSPENDISVSDPQVSRLHAEILHKDGEWKLESHGRNGTWIRGSRVQAVTLSHRSIFQLGSTGPMLQFLIHEAPSESRSATIDSFDPRDFDFLDVDPQVLADEVSRIAESDTFLRLQDEITRKNHTKPLDLEGNGNEGPSNSK